jgi:type IV pilus assembly protein PilC
MEDIGLVILIALYILLGWKKPAVALITSPFVAGMVLILGITTQNVVIITSSPILFFLTLLAVSLSKKEPDSENWPQKCAKWFFIALIILIFLITFLIGLALSIHIFSIIFFIIFISSIIAYSLTSRNMTTAYVLSTIGASMRQNLPLPMALESAASGISDKRSKILNNIKKWLVQGYSLSESIKRGYSKCPGYAVAMITAAERINQLPLALKAIEANITTQTEENQKIRPVHPIYPVLVITTTFLILLGVMTFIIPTFSAVLEEMVDAPQLPASTRVVMDIMNFAAYRYGWVLGLLILMIILITIPASIYFKFRARRPDKPYLFSRIGDYIKWHLPVLHWFERNYSMLQVVEMLRLSLNAGCTVNNAIENTIGLDVNNRFKRRLRKWLQKVERGDNIAVAARESKLGSTLAWAFDEKVNQGNTITILETLEAFYRSNYSYSVNLARFIIWPCIILCMGITVGFLVYAIYSPSIAIITHLMTLVTP